MAERLKAIIAVDKFNLNSILRELGGAYFDVT
jgi:hypothetical protein